MKVAVVGVGYVGLVSGACFAQMGNAVTCVDVDEAKIAALKEGCLPIYEPGLREIVEGNLKLGTLSFTSNLKEALKASEIAFVAVGTPMGADGRADLRPFLQAVIDIGKHMQHPLVVVNKSTVPVGTAETVRTLLEGELERRGVDLKFSVVSNPEFLKEGAAIEDFMSPDRIVMGSDDPEAIDKMRELYSSFAFNHDRILVMDTRSAEMTKYAANAMLATKISFMNEIANICELVGADVNRVRLGVGSDSRIGYRYIYPGCGYGGSCFPKDLRALEKLALDHGYTPNILRAVEEVNVEQKTVLSRKIVSKYGPDLAKRRFAVWGLAFKPETSDMREAPSIELIGDLTSRGATVQVYDPVAMDEAKKDYLAKNSKVVYACTKYEALKDADALLLVTEWKEFRNPDFEEMAKLLKKPVIFDGRNQYPPERLASHGFEYYPIGVAAAEVLR